MKGSLGIPVSSLLGCTDATGAEADQPFRLVSAITVGHAIEPSFFSFAKA